MEYITFPTPPFPYFIMAGNALYRPGDIHRRRTGINCFDLIFVEYGTLYMTDQDHTYTLNPNDVLILHPGRTHFGHRISDCSTFFHWLHFYTTEQYTFSEALHTDFLSSNTSIYNAAHSRITLPCHQSLSAEKAGQFLSLIRPLETLIINKYQQSAVGSSIDRNELQQQILFLQILSLLIYQSETATDNNIARAAMQYIKDNYRKTISLEELARKLNCHPTHIIRCMKKQYQVTPTQAQIHLRIEHAQKLLANPALSCSEIALHLGFTSPSYFCRVFKKVTSQTPQEFRKKFNLAG